MTTSILPVNKVLTDSGCIWESQLAAQGWNELPDEKKVGRVVKNYTDGSCDVHFDALNYTATGIYIDELKPVYLQCANT